jgi:uncharacterized protein
MTVVAAVVAGVYLAVCGLAFAVQRSLVFPAPAGRSPPAGRAVSVEVPGGTFVVWREAAAQGPVVVHFHGNGEQAGNLGGLAEAYAAGGVSFAAVEYPGYAGAPGSPGEASLVDAGRKALQHLTGPMGVARDRLVLSGQSVGTGVAMALAEEGWGTRLVLLSPYTSLPDVAARAFPWLPVRLLLRDRFDSLARAPRVRVPVLVVHGTHDEVIPFELGARLSGAFPPGGCRLLQVEGAHHNDLWAAPPTLPEVLRFVRGEGPP